MKAVFDKLKIIQELANNLDANEKEHIDVLISEIKEELNNKKSTYNPINDYYIVNDSNSRFVDDYDFNIFSSRWKD